MLIDRPNGKMKFVYEGYWAKVKVVRAKVVQWFAFDLMAFSLVIYAR